MPIRLRVNGREVQALIEPRELLLDLLRERLGLTGAKRSCDVQVCGACTVLVGGVPVSACCTLAYEARGQEVTTVEGLAGDGRLHRLQRAFVEHTAVQCGFCTPGMLLSLAALLQENPHPDRGELRRYLSGNLCRCTGYWNILAAVEAAVEESEIA
jgi:aerobic-type carbon monoxide dehydrogenase small subunit (CoxS/CutS family)